MPDTMPQLMFVRKGRLEWREVPAPRLQGPGEALVRPVVASRCDGDSLFLFHDFSRALQLGAALHVIDPAVRAIGDRPFAGPFAYGHECLAEVVAVGEEVQGVHAGQRVVVPWGISCGSCGTCRRRLTAHCERTPGPIAAYGFGGRAGGWGGMVSDILRVPFADAMLLPAPAGVPAMHLSAASDNIADAWRTVGPHLRDEPGAAVLVVGGAAHSIGLYAAGIAVALGASQVDYVDTDRARLDLAAAFGANPIALRPAARWFERGSPPLGRTYPITVDASNREAGLRFAIRALAAGGVCTPVGFYFRTGTPLPLWQMYLNGTRLHVGLSNVRGDMPDVLNLLAGGRFDPNRLAPRVSAWEDAPEALLDRDAVKVVVARRDVLEEPRDVVIGGGAPPNGAAAPDRARHAPARRIESA